MGYTKWTDELKKRVQELSEQGLDSRNIVEKLYEETGVYYARRSVRRYASVKATQSHNKGHFHNEKTVDNGGVISRQLGTVKPNDKYEIMNGWTLSKKELYALEYDSDKLVAEWHV